MPDHPAERYAAENREHVVVALPDGSDQVSTLYRENCELRQEVERLRRGDWTAEEIHDICHNLHGKVGAEEFALGCAREQQKLYGCAPHAEAVGLLQAEVERLRAERDAWLADCARLAESLDEASVE